MTTNAVMTTHDPHQIVNRPARLSPLSWLALFAGAGIFAFLIYHNLAHPHHAPAGEAQMPPLWQIGILPFVFILAGIALLPILPATHHWWESNANRLGFALVCSALTLVYVAATHGLQDVVTVLDHALVVEYIPFIVLLFALYVISGGIRLTGDLAAHPGTNTAFLAIGAASASFVGTTGASMLLIRPLLQTNSERRYKVHTVVFFIFLVSNIGGTLLPIGDPPLFLGYLRGVPFFWTLNLWLPWAVTCGVLLVMYFVWDTLAYRKEAARDIARDETQKRPLRLEGWMNFLWLAGVVLAVAFVSPDKPLPFTDVHAFPFMRELLMLGLVGASLLLTPKRIRIENSFNYAAIIEVAALFIGIFVAMQIPIEVLRAAGPMLTEQYVTQPWQFYWATGSLSSFLDNAPTYVVFFELGRTMDLPADASMVDLLGGGVIGTSLLVAVSLGSVFMGAMSYIGNGPNFMVKAIAEQSGVRMPSFFGYMLKYSIPILIPVFILVTLLFLLAGSPLSIG